MLRNWACTSVCSLCALGGWGGIRDILSFSWNEPRTFVFVTMYPVLQNPFSNAASPITAQQLAWARLGSGLIDVHNPHSHSSDTFTPIGAITTATVMETPSETATTTGSAAETAGSTEPALSTETAGETTANTAPETEADIAVETAVDTAVETALSAETATETSGPTLFLRKKKWKHPKYFTQWPS